MNKLEEFEKINKLFITYGALLSKSQYDLMNDYYTYNLSISEISENRKISRAAVNDALSKARAYLEEYENKLHIISNNDDVIKTLEKIKENVDEKSKKIIEELEGRIANGI